ncbi:MAG TPA: hypothetical protein VJ909_07630 [Prolixibacteraceae bacterium]|nr:hypothetical protein [Prolixibacteraceae bacterium]
MLRLEREKEIRQAVVFFIIAVLIVGVFVWWLIRNSTEFWILKNCPYENGQL